MSTNEERLSKSISQIEKYITAAESVGHTATQYREEDGTLRILVFSDLGLVLDALSYATHELKETARELKEAQATLGRVRRELTRQEAHPGVRVLRALREADESAPRPAPTEPSKDSFNHYSVEDGIRATFRALGMSPELTEEAISKLPNPASPAPTEPKTTNAFIDFGSAAAPAPIEAGERFAQTPAIREVIATLDFVADRMDEHAYGEIRTAVESIPECETYTAVAHDEHEADAGEREAREGLEAAIYTHPSAPIEVTDEMVEVGCRTFYEGARGITSWERMSQADPDLADRYRDGIRAALTAAFKEMNR